MRRREVTVKRVCATSSNFANSCGACSGVHSGEEHASERRAIGGQAAADTESDRHDPPCGRARHVNHRAIVEHRNRSGFAELLAQLFQHRLGGDGDRRPSRGRHSRD